MWTRLKIGIGEEETFLQTKVNNVYNARCNAKIKKDQSSLNFSKSLQGSYRMLHRAERTWTRAQKSKRDLWEFTHHSKPLNERVYHSRNTLVDMQVWRKIRKAQKLSKSYQGPSGSKSQRPRVSRCGYPLKYGGSAKGVRKRFCYKWRWAFVAHVTEIKRGPMIL